MLLLPAASASPDTHLPAPIPQRPPGTISPDAAQPTTCAPRQEPDRQARRLGRSHAAVSGRRLRPHNHRRSRGSLALTGAHSGSRVLSGLTAAGNRGAFSALVPAAGASEDPSRLVPAPEPTRAVVTPQGGAPGPSSSGYVAPGSAQLGPGSSARVLVRAGRPVHDHSSASGPSSAQPTDGTGAWPRLPGSRRLSRPWVRALRELPAVFLKALDQRSIRYSTLMKAQDVLISAHDVT